MTTRPDLTNAFGPHVRIAFERSRLGVPQPFTTIPKDDEVLNEVIAAKAKAKYLREAQKVGLEFDIRPQFKSLFDDDWRWATVVAHRRAGKTVAAIQRLVKYASTAPKTFPPHRYSLISPTYTQARDTAWQYLEAYVQNIPGMDIRVSELSVTFPHNDARVRLYGSDNYDSLRGGYNMGVVLDETGDHDPRAWQEAVRPTLSDYQGWGLFIGTPRGDNLFKEMADTAKLNEDGNWMYLELKASKTGILPPEELRDASRQLTKNQYLAEYECSFAAGAIGAYYADDIANAEAETPSRVLTSVPYDRSADVYCSWDLGIGDSTALLVFQLVGKEIHFIDCMESSGVDLGTYVDWVKALPYRINEHVLPHDAAARELQTGNSRQEFLEQRGLKCRLLPKHEIIDGINAVRVAFPAMWFDRKLALAIKAFRNYRADYDTKRKVFQLRPRHDWASNYADSLRYAIMSIDGYKSDSDTYSDYETDWVL